MSKSANLTNVQAYRDYVQDYANELISKAFYSPKTIDMSTVHEGVKGRKTLTILEIADDLIKAWKCSFDPMDDAVNYIPRHIDVSGSKVDLSFCPEEYESSYLGMFRKKGQNPGTDLPFERYTLDKVLSKIAQEIESSLWTAEKAVTVTPGVTPLRQTFNGLLKIIADEITATTLTPFATPGGAITDSNAVALIEDMWVTLGDAYKEIPVNIYVSWSTFQKYQKNYRAEFGKYTNVNQDNRRITLDFGIQSTLIAMPGMGNSNRVIITPAENIHVAYDEFKETEMFHFEQNKRAMDFWMDFKMGVNFALVDDACLVVNDLV